jgi:hypothetical protein
MPLPIQIDASHLDLSPRLFRSASVTASPTDATETAIATVTCTGDIAVTLGVLIVGWFSVTIGTNGVTLAPKIRRTNAAGTAVKTGGAETVVATQVYPRAIVAFDTGPTMPGQVYVMTLTVGSASAGSTVSAVELACLVV